MQHCSTIFRQFLSFIPRYQFNKCVSNHSGDRYVKSFKCWSQFIADLYAQISEKDSLRDIETSLKAQKRRLYHLGCSDVPKSTLANANQKRDYRIFEDLFYKIFGKCHDLIPKKKFKFKNDLYSLDSTTIDLCLSLFPWAKFRTRKGAIKLHCLRDHRSELPCFLSITDGKTHDVKAARKMKLPLSPDSILVVDKAYLDFKWLKSLDSEGVFFVTRAKDNMKYKVLGQHSFSSAKGIMSDEEIILTGPQTQKKYPDKLRLVTFYDEEAEKEYRFINNNFKFAASTIAQIYKYRWEIETFFRWIKQNLKIKTFLGTSKNAVLTQIWIAMIYYLLLAYIKYQTKCSHSLLNFTRIIKTTIFERIPMIDLLSLKPAEVNKAFRGAEQLCLF